MWTRRCVLLLMPLLAVAVGAAAPRAGAQADAADKYIGVWSGTWDGGGGGGGGFELTLQHEKDKPQDKKMTGKVAVTGEPEYTASLTSVSFDGAKMTAKYDFPPEPSLQVVLVATFEGEAATGTWSVTDRGSASEVANGGWKVKRAEKK